MKSLLSVLPLVGFALAQAQKSCSAARITKTITERETVTVRVPAEVPTGYQAPPVDAEALTGGVPSTSCSRRTFTATFTEQETITVPRPSMAPTTSAAEEDEELTITIDSTAFVTPSPVPFFPNGTFNASTRAPFTRTSLDFAFPPLVPTSSVKSPAATFAPEKPSNSSSAAQEPVPAPSSQAPHGAAPVQLPSPTPSPSAAASPKAADTPVSGSSEKRGEATFYGGNVDGGMCSFTGYTIPSGIFGTALSDSNWDGADACGSCLSVTGPNGNSIKVMVVDQCPGCGTNHVDLFPDAFAKLAEPSKGIIDVSWETVSCDIDSPIVLKNKEGTSSHWFSMQVMNANVPVSKLEVSTDGGSTWQATQRQPYNFFENSAGFGVDTVDVKVTSTNGDSVVVKSVGTAANSKTTASGNFA